jgi:hypothetical protein
MFNPDRIETAFAPEIENDFRAKAPARPAGFQLPGWIWQAMFTAYGLFFAALLTTFRGDGEALFMVVISLLYALMYFGTASLLARLGPNDSESPLDLAGGELQTWTGSMGTGAVAAQVLTVPACLALFAMAIAVIRAVVL